ncbi:thiamine phosphate synthase [Candidatus Nitrosacidococcus sp. I8]|uniref:thiamine phosphate synthase n=1 Tax=Candidatus Nitrosacidococcus sp. I8 TaxID=2942908 RepID=UPI0022271B90|nr:thiamine phosphate synthase [Candidatus Nitrosacidococcus sp. I8]CAH9019730.1 Thiamine-phosphate synthase [Candidatus Nitrosacidococcus sp. I8]
MTHLIYGLYAIVDTGVVSPNHFHNAASEALLGGANLIQYRDKNQSPKQRYEQATDLRQLCSQHNVPLIINDDIELAAQVKADGVHLGKNDGSLLAARQALGEKAIIGISCYNELSRAIAAWEAGASYIALGRFFPSITKPKPIFVSLELLKEVREKIPLPIVAIGGITPQNALPIIQGGADAIAVIGGIFRHQNIRHQAMAYKKLFPS